MQHGRRPTGNRLPERIPSKTSFKTEGVDGVKLRSLPRGVKTEENTDERAEAEGGEDGFGRNQGVPAELGGDDGRATYAEQNPNQAAPEAEGDRLDQKLHEDVAAAGADGHAHADLPGALGHAHEHDVH